MKPVIDLHLIKEIFHTIRTSITYEKSEKSYIFSSDRNLNVLYIYISTIKIKIDREIFNSFYKFAELLLNIFKPDNYGSKK